MTNYDTNNIKNYYANVGIDMVILDIIIIKTSSTGPGGKSKLFKNYLRNPSIKQQRHWNTEKQTEGSTKRLTAPLNPTNHPVSNTCVGKVINYSTHESGPAGNTLQIGTFYTLILQTLMGELQPLGLSNSDRSRWKLIILLLLKKVSSARLRESGIHPISPKTPAPQYQPI